MGISDADFFLDLHREFVIRLDFPFLDANAELSSYTLDFGPGRFFLKWQEGDEEMFINILLSRKRGD